MRFVNTGFAGAAIALVVLALPPPTRAAGVQAWVTPPQLTPTSNARIVVHVRGLAPRVTVQINIAPPPPGMSYIRSENTVASVQGSVDAPISFVAREPGMYSADVSNPRDGKSYGSVRIPVRAVVTRTCGGKVALSHVFSRGPEVLIQGTAAKPGTRVWLLGIGYDPCSAVSLATAPPGSDFGTVNTGVRTDRYGVFRVPVQIPRGYRFDILFVYPKVNMTDQPIVAIGVNRQ
jgi:hypothetical protein